MGGQKSKSETNRSGWKVVSTVDEESTRGHLPLLRSSPRLRSGRNVRKLDSSTWDGSHAGTRLISRHALDREAFLIRHVPDNLVCVCASKWRERKREREVEREGAGPVCLVFAVSSSLALTEAMVSRSGVLIA